jgi:hypothetical protein
VVTLAIGTDVEPETDSSDTPKSNSLKSIMIDFVCLHYFFQSYQLLD